MPPRPGHHLDLYLIPDAERPLPPGEGLWNQLEADGIRIGRLAGPKAQMLVRGGFAGVRLDDPGRARLYANGQGGFRVSCPDQQGNVVPAFQSALTAWRGGAARRLACPSCGRGHDLADLRFSPPAVFGLGAVVLIDVAHHRLTDGGLRWAQDLLGPVHVVGSRR